MAITVICDQTVLGSVAQNNRVGVHSLTSCSSQIHFTNRFFMFKRCFTLMSIQDCCSSSSWFLHLCYQKRMPKNILSKEIKKMCLGGILSALLSLTQSTAIGEQSDVTAPDSPSTASKSHWATYRVDSRVAITAPAKTRKLRVWLPIPPTTDTQVIKERRIETFPREIEALLTTEPRFGNRFAYFEFDSPDGAQEIRHTFTAEIAELAWHVDYATVQPSTDWPTEFELYRQPDPRSQDAVGYQDILRDIQAAANQQSEQLMEAIRWVDKNLAYDSVQASLSANPAHALEFRRGHCSDYHGLCSSFARDIGYPARVLYGTQMFDKGSPSHCKLEVYLPPYGWVTYDLSETQKLTVKILEDPQLSATQRRELSQRIKLRTLRGFRENTWLLVTRGENFPLVPVAAADSVPIIRTIYAEADGIPLPEPDPSNPANKTFAWMTMHRVDAVGGNARRFSSPGTFHVGQPHEKLRR